MKIGSAALITALLVTAKAAAEEVQFMGIDLGAPPPLECAYTTIGSTSIYTYAGGPFPCWSISGRQPGIGLPSGDEYTIEIAASGDKTPTGTRGIDAEVIAGRIESISVGTDGFQHQESLLGALTAKFGKPSKQAAIPVQSGAGAKFQSLQATWEKPNLHVTFIGMLGSIDAGTISVQTDIGKAAFDRKYGGDKSF